MAFGAQTGSGLTVSKVSKTWLGLEALGVSRKAKVCFHDVLPILGVDRMEARQ